MKIEYKDASKFLTNEELTPKIIEKKNWKAYMPEVVRLIL